jgi:hypothetical protein
MTNPVETFISQFVQALEQHQSPQGQVIADLLRPVFEPVFAKIADTFHGIEHIDPALSSTLSNICDVLQSRLDELYSAFDHSSTSNNFTNGDYWNDLHNKAFDFDLI